MTSNGTGLNCLRIEGIKTVADVTKLREDSLRLIQGKEGLRIDAQGVQRLDTSVLQLLVVLAKQAAADGRSLEWQGVSEAFRESARVVGLERDLGL